MPTTFSRCVALASVARLCDFSSASWLPCWNGVLEWPRCAWSDGSTESCMTLPVMDQVALGETFEGSSGLSQSSELSWGQKDQLKATGLLALISYLIAAFPQVYTPANRPDIRISSFVQARGIWPHRRGVRFAFLPVVDERRFP